MSNLARLKIKVHYEKNVPRCETCIQFKESKIVLSHNSIPKRINQHCKLHGFAIARASVCDTWQSAEGETLEAIDTKKGKMK
jgi:hypothetical protein